MINLFISHSWNYSENYDSLKQLIAKKHYFTFRDYSISEDEPKNNWEEIANNIQWCSVVLVIVAVAATSSKSIKKEIALAKHHNKPIIAVVPYRAEKVSNLVNECDRVVQWNTDSIVNAIRELT